MTELVDVTENKEYLDRQKIQIAELKKKRNAIILAHNYQRDEVQEIADFSGDSLDLSRKAAGTDADVIVFCGVHFMAESAAMLSPQKTVLLPVPEAGCYMADMITVKKLRRLKSQYPKAVVVCYVNAPADVKAESDICCTSANAVKVVNSLPDDEVIFVPDRCLAAWVAKNTTKTIIPCEGFCPTHFNLGVDDVEEAKARHPQAVFMAHPECIPEVQDMADAICSTSQMLAYAKKSPAMEFLVGTETGLLYRLRNENPSKRFYPASEHLVCGNMKLTTLGWVVSALKYMRYMITVPNEVRERATRALERMMAVS